ncbi:MAG TPA: prephenate dehydrogenase/arogenate dehydrogenase family protein [Vicinamibacterales bacterium]|nr:prephenate dehydrogenase/arogenate dehydrogenase family protein [Vicinamibacterales bacterium]
MSSDTGPFPTIGIVGLGLIGGSIALRARANWPAVRLLGVDGTDVTHEAVSRGLVNEPRTSVADLTDADLIVLATPVPAVIELIDAVARARLGGVITDVGSTKRDIVQAATRAGLANFVGGHPVAGSERGGLSAARADLFEGRPWLLVGAAPDAAPVRRLEQFVTALGARPMHLDATTHDRAMAYLSHLPQLLAAALMRAAADGCDADALATSGRAFRDMTRLASSPADVWKGILATNADFVAEAARALVAHLPASREQLADARVIDDLFTQANQGRARLDGTRPPASDS